MHRCKAIVMLMALWFIAGFVWAQEAETQTLPTTSPVVADSVAETAGGAGFDPGSLIIGHVTDAHSWHFFDVTHRDGTVHAVSIPLPVILINDGHLDVFMSSRFEHGHADYKGYRLVGGGLSKEEVICVDAAGAPIMKADGTMKKPVDLSITKTVAALFIVVLLLIVAVLHTVKAYRRRGLQAPKGFQSLMEMLVVYVRDEICAPMIGPKYERYLPYILTLFFFIFLCNIMGLIPFFPGGANITGNIAVTMILALITFFITNISGNKHYWTDIFNTPGCPAWLKIFPLMPIIEVVGIFTKPFVLMIRLFANMTAGHIMVLGMIVVIFIISNLYGLVVGSLTSVLAVAFALFIDVLECLVAYIQAFVFTMLTCVYIGLAVEEPAEA